MSTIPTVTPITLYQQFKTLHEEELYDSLVDLGDLLLTSDSRPRNLAAQRELFRGAREEFRCVVLYGYALIQEHRYKQAIDVYVRACAMLLHTYPPPGSAGRIGGRAPNGPKVESPPGTIGFERLFTEDDVKYRFAQAYLFADDTDEASAMLETIPPANRSAKVHALMIKLNPSRPTFALDKMKNIVRQVPMAIRVLNSWFVCGGKQTELSANLGRNAAEDKVMELINNLVHCCFYMCSGNYMPAHKAASTMQDHPVLAYNPTLLTIQAKCQNAVGNSEKAAKILSGIDHSHPNFFRDMDEYAAVLYDQGDLQTLQKLGDRLIRCASSSAEAWTCKGYSALSRKDLTTALRYADHAISLEETHSRAHVLRGLIHFKKDDYFVAQRSFRRVLDICTHNLDAHKHLIEIYQKKYGEKESLAAASVMYKSCKKNPSCVQIYADCSIHYGHRLREISAILDKHLKGYPKDRKAAVLLATAYEKLKSPDRAVEVLKRQLVYGSNKEIHQLLAKLYGTLQNTEKVSEHTNLAESFPLATIDPRADSPLPGPSNGFRSSSPGSPRATSPNEEDGANEDSEADDDEDDAESYME